MMTNMDETRGPTYIISMDIEEDIKALKAKIGYDLQMNLTNSQVLVLTQKLSDNETLSSVCGSYKGMIQVQFSVEHGDGNPHIQIYDVRRPNEVIYREETAGTGEDPKMDWKSVKRRLQTSEWVASNDFERLRKASGMPQNPRQWSSNQVQVWFEWAKKRFEFPEEVRKNLDVRGENLLTMNDEALKRVFPTDQKSPFDMHLQILRKTKVVAVPRGSSDEGAQSNSPEETSSQNEVELLPPPSTEFAREEIRSTENVAETLDHLAPSSSRNACLIPPSSQSNLEEENSIFQVSQTVLSGHSLQLWQFLLLLLTDPKHVDIIRWCGEDGEFRFEKPDVVAKLWGERKGKSNMNYEKLSRAIRYYYDCDEKIVSKVFGKNYTYRFELDLRDVLGYSSQEIRDQIEEYNSADRTR